MIIFITSQLISSNLYAINISAQQHNIDFDTHQCSINEYAHEHYHTHNASKHQHKHGHTNINILDFFVHIDDKNRFIIPHSKDKYLECKYFISNPTLNSIFRPPIV